MPKGKSISNLKFPDDLDELQRNVEYHNRRNIDRLLELSDDLTFQRPKLGLTLALAAKELLGKVRLRDRKSRAQYELRVDAVLGTAHRAAGEPEEAFSIYTKRLEEFPAAINDCSFLCRFGVLFADMEEWVEARECTNKAIALNTCAESLLCRAYVCINGYWSGEDFDIKNAAEDSLQVLRNTQPSKRNLRIFCTALHNLTVVLLERRLDRKRISEVLKLVDWLYRKHLSGKMKNRWNLPYAKLRWVRGLAHSAVGSYALAVRDLDEARLVLAKVRAKPDLARASLDLVEILLDAGGREARLRIPKLADEIINLQGPQDKKSLSVLQAWRQMIQDGRVSDQAWNDVLLHVRGRKTRRRGNPWEIGSAKDIDTLGF